MEKEEKGFFGRFADGYRLTHEEERKAARQRDATTNEFGERMSFKKAEGVRGLVSRVLDGVSRALGAEEYGA